MKSYLYFILFLLCFFAKAQNNFEISDQEKVSIPFKLINNLIFIPINVNGSELTFLLDTGVSETIIFSLEDKELNLYETEKIKFTGLGGSESIEGLKSVNNVAKISNNFINTSFTLFIILSEDFNISSHVGIPVNGIIGYHFFKNHRVFIDYIAQKITIYNNPEKLDKKIKKFTIVPISIEENKPYFYAGVEMTNTLEKEKLLIDIGNSDPIWLFPTLIKDFVYNRPNIEDFIGRGFNGDIFGKRSRIHHLYIENFKFTKPLIAMPDEYSIQHVNMVKDRKGSIGSEILRRFYVVFDYPNQLIYLKKNSHFDDPFSFNMSGLDFKHDGMEWKEEKLGFDSAKSDKINDGTNVFKSSFQVQFVLKPMFSIAGVRKDSPAYKAGLLANDKLISINGKKASEFTLQKIFNLMKSEEGKTIKIVVLRNHKDLEFKFVLEDPIPYQEQE